MDTSFHFVKIIILDILRFGNQIPLILSSSHPLLQLQHLLFDRPDGLQKEHITCQFLPQSLGDLAPAEIMYTDKGDSLHFAPPINGQRAPIH